MKHLRKNNNVLDLTINLWDAYRILSSILTSKKDFNLTISECILLHHIYDLLNYYEIIHTSDLIKRNIFSTANLIYVLNSLAMRSFITLKALNQDDQSFMIMLSPLGISIIDDFRSKTLKINHNDIGCFQKLQDALEICLNK